MEVPAYIAEQTLRMAENYCHFITYTQPDRLDWRPDLAGSARMRSILEQVAECVDVNYKIAALLRGEELPTTETATFAAGPAACDSIMASSQALAQAIGALSVEDLEKTFQHPRAAMLGKNVILMPMRNMGYHIGQLNQIQMLYGDAEFHVPANWR